MWFEDMDVWKRSVRLSIAIYKELAKLRDFGFKDQITRSGLSIPSNMAEARSDVFDYIERFYNKRKQREIDNAKLQLTTLN
jgi:four helix bundle protein